MLKSIFIQASACQRCPPWVSMVFRQGLMIISMAMLTMMVRVMMMFTMFTFTFTCIHIYNGVWTNYYYDDDLWVMSTPVIPFTIAGNEFMISKTSPVIWKVQRGSQRVSTKYLYLYLYLHLHLYLYLNLYVPTRLAPTGPSPSETIWILLHLDRGVLTSAATEGST